jgi:tRNA(Ile)-lysidine synthase
LSLQQAHSSRWVDVLFNYFHDLFPEDCGIAVAVSGGADSMALCSLLTDWAKLNNQKIVALTVDHGLRHEATKEVQKVAKWLAVWGVRHEILYWEGKKPITGIQAAARTARYSLMLNWCYEENFTHLVTGHQLEDQVETFLMRAESGSGLDGLSSMASIISRGDICLVRPLLHISKNLLREYLASKQQAWIEDPSNHSLAFRRTSIRQIVLNLEGRGMPAPRILGVINHLKVVKQYFADLTVVFFRRAVRVLPEAYGIIDLKALKDLPDPILERVLIKIIFELNGKVYPSRRRSLKRSIENIKSLEIYNFTLGGCQFIFRDLSLIVCRDLRTISEIKVVSGDEFIWDSLFKVVIFGPKNKKGKVGALGKQGWMQIVQKSPALREIQLPYPVKISLPTLFDERGVVEVPGLKYSRGDLDQLKLLMQKL